MEEPVYTMLLIMAIFLALKLFFLLLNLVMWLLLGLSFFFFRIILFSWIDFDFDAMLLWFFKCFWIGCRGFVRFVNVRDGKGATPLHLASRQRRPECVHILLDSGALVCASTGRYGYWSLKILWLIEITWILCILLFCVLKNCYLKFCSYPGSTPLHLAARGGSLDCIRELLAWGADRIQRDSSGYGLVLDLLTYLNIVHLHLCGLLVCIWTISVNVLKLL